MLLDGDTKEYRFSYDDTGHASEATFSYTGKLICTFKFERYSNGVIKRTLAIGPDGELYAEYPDHEIHIVTIQGKPPAQIDGVKIYKLGPWWKPSSIP